MFHGTSSNLVSKILVEGLTPIPKKKTWDHGDKASFGGVYLTSNIEYAYRMAKIAADQHGGDPSIVVADIETRSAWADEDDIARLYDWGYLKDRSVDIFIEFVRGFTGISMHSSLVKRVRDILSMKDISIANVYDNLSRSLRSIAYKGENVRIMSPIKTSKGRNKILSIVNIVKGDLQVVYGLEYLPRSFFFQWRKKMVNLGIS